MAELLTNFELKLDMDRVLQGQGAYQSVAKPRESVLALIRKMLTEAYRLIVPAVVYELYPVREVRHHRLILGNGRVLRIGQVAAALGSAQEIAVLIGTVGRRLEERVSRYFDEGYPARGTILDGIGSVAVEELIERACRVIDGLAVAKGVQTSAPFSPGYLNWTLGEQWVLFDLLPADEIGVTLTSSCVMIPRKSLSVVLGLGKGLRAEGRSPCDDCWMGATCRYRKPIKSGHRKLMQ